jgi:hypothetical protein
MSEDAVEALLLEQFGGPVPDDGFCDSVMQQLPQRRRRQMWPLVMGVVAGAGACWLSLASAPVLRIGWRDWLSGEMSTPAIVLLLTMASISLLALLWTVAEADDRRSET